MFGRLAKGGTVLVDVTDGALSFSYPDSEEPRDGKGGKKEPVYVE